MVKACSATRRRPALLAGLPLPPASGVAGISPWWQPCGPPVFVPRCVRLCLLPSPPAEVRPDSRARRALGGSTSVPRRRQRASAGESSMARASSTRQRPPPRSPAAAGGAIFIESSMAIATAAKLRPLPDARRPTGRPLALVLVEGPADADDPGDAFRRTAEGPQRAEGHLDPMVGHARRVEARRGSR